MGEKRDCPTSETLRRIMGLFWWISFSYDWLMVFKATINQSQVMLVHSNNPTNCCAEGLYPLPLQFLEGVQKSSKIGSRSCRFEFFFVFPFFDGLVLFLFLFNIFFTYLIGLVLFVHATGLLAIREVVQKAYFQSKDFFRHGMAKSVALVGPFLK